MVKQEIRFSLDIPCHQIDLRKAVTLRGTTMRGPAGQCWADCDPRNTRARDDVRARAGDGCSRDLVVSEMYSTFRGEANRLAKEILL